MIYILGYAVILFRFNGVLFSAKFVKVPGVKYRTVHNENFNNTCLNTQQYKRKYQSNVQNAINGCITAV